MSTRSFALFASLAALTFSADARAFCRTTTIPLEASSEDPSFSGICWTAGMDIAWGSDQVPYGVSSAGSKYFTAAQVGPIADQAFAAWRSVTCDGGEPAVQPENVGLLTYIPDGGSCTTSTACNAAANDVIAFDDDAWPYYDPASTVALTTVTYGVRDGRIFQAYTEVNTAEQRFTLQAPAPPGGFDLLSVLTHEAGHFLGLAHSTIPTAVMWAFNPSGHSELSPDDEAAICAAYPPKASGGGCASVAGGVRLSAEITVGGACAALVLLRRRSRCVVRRRRNRPAMSRSLPVLRP